MAKWNTQYWVNKILNQWYILLISETYGDYKRQYKFFSEKAHLEVLKGESSMIYDKASKRFMENGIRGEWTLSMNFLELIYKPSSYE